MKKLLIKFWGFLKEYKTTWKTAGTLVCYWLLANAISSSKEQMFATLALLIICEIMRLLYDIKENTTPKK